MSKNSSKTLKLSSNNNLFLFIKALIVSLIITFACIILFAVVIKFANLSDGFIVPVNLVIKALSICVGTIIFTKERQSGLKKGLIFAVVYITLAFLVFSALCKTFSLSISLLLDYLFGCLVGAIVGIIRVNRKV